jgi:hypothetical protein
MFGDPPVATKHLNQGLCVHAAEIIHEALKHGAHLEPLAEVQGALLVVEVLHLPHPELGGLLSSGNGLEHLQHKHTQY